MTLAAAVWSCSPPFGEVDELEDLDGSDFAEQTVDWSKQPFLFTAAFDGSRSFRVWAESTRFARDVRARYGKSVHYTYFINTTYYDSTITNSGLGYGALTTPGRSLVRFALTQQAVNEGHEIANHTVRHFDGSSYTRKQWLREIGDVDALLRTNLFQPVLDDDPTSPTRGQPVFPRWEAVPGAAPGQAGASCVTDDDCHTAVSSVVPTLGLDRKCLEVAPGKRFCTQTCNKLALCPTGMECGAGPNFEESVGASDVCVPRPAFPVVYAGRTLFEASGAVNPGEIADAAHPDRLLKPYRLIGFRAPVLGTNPDMYEMLHNLGYRYDTSQMFSGYRSVGPTRAFGRLYPSILQFPLLRLLPPREPNGTQRIPPYPMDYSYLVAKTNAATMKKDYRQEIRVAATPAKRLPWNIGHHFALWNNGEYLATLESTVEWVVQGCPADNDASSRACDDGEVVSFSELHSRFSQLSSDAGRLDAGSADAGRLDAGPADAG